LTRARRKLLFFAVPLAVGFAWGCASVPHDARGRQMPFDTDTVLLPAHTDAALLPLPLRDLKVRLVLRYFDTDRVPQPNPVIPPALEQACAKTALARLCSYGWNPVDDASAEAIVELACIGTIDDQGRPRNEMKTIEDDASIEIQLPATDLPSAVVRDATGAVIATVPTGPRHLRCDLPAASDRLRACATRLREWDDARVEHGLESSAEIAAFARQRHP
jgi:hypothetical protein